MATDNLDAWQAGQPVVTLGQALGFEQWIGGAPLVSFGVAEDAESLTLALNQTINLTISLVAEVGPFFGPIVPDRHYPVSLVEIITT